VQAPSRTSATFRCGAGRERLTTPLSELWSFASVPRRRSPSSLRVPLVFGKAVGSHWFSCPAVQLCKQVCCVSEACPSCLTLPYFDVSGRSRRLELQQLDVHPSAFHLSALIQLPVSQPSLRNIRTSWRRILHVPNRNSDQAIHPAIPRTCKATITTPTTATIMVARRV
jgi:hypothetical protein